MPSFEIENSLKGIVAGIDEAGRGPLCGPVFASCVVLNKNNFPKNINDSKKITEKNRNKIFNDILNFEKQGLLFYGVASVDASIIDKINIREATKLVMKKSYENLINKYNIKIDNLIVDGNFTPLLDINSISVIKGDQKSYSIACASIIAKVLRDEELIKNHEIYPQYNWVKNKGYGTREHINMIKKYGIIKNYHRETFCKNFL